MESTKLKGVALTLLLAAAFVSTAATLAGGQTNQAESGFENRPASGYVMAGKLRTHYFEWSRDKKETIILLHGLYDTADVWTAVAARLSERYRVIAIDRRGAGKTMAPAGGYDARSLAKDVVAFLDALRLDRPVIVGHSAGANVALTVGSIAPEKVSSIVLVDGGFWPKKPGPIELTSRKCDKRQSECRRNLAIERGSMEYDPAPLFSQVKVPVLLVVAMPREDEAKANAEMLTEMRNLAEETATKKLAKGSLEFISDSGHWIQTDQPIRLAESINTFVKARENSGPGKK